MSGTWDRAVGELRPGVAAGSFHARFTETRVVLAVKLQRRHRDGLADAGMNPATIGAGDGTNQPAVRLHRAVWNKGNTRRFAVHLRDVVVQPARCAPRV